MCEYASVFMLAYFIFAHKNRIICMERIAFVFNVYVVDRNLILVFDVMSTKEETEEKNILIL